MKVKVKIISGGLEYASSHTEVEPLLAERDIDENLTCKSINSQLLGDVDGKLFINLVFTFDKIIAQAVFKDEIIVDYIYIISRMDLTGY